MESQRKAIRFTSRTTCYPSPRSEWSVEETHLCNEKAPGKPGAFSLHHSWAALVCLLQFGCSGLLLQPGSPPVDWPGHSSIQHSTKELGLDPVGVGCVRAGIQVVGDLVLGSWILHTEVDVLSRGRVPVDDVLRHSRNVIPSQSNLRGQIVGGSEMLRRRIDHLGAKVD
jgi:hypothetical protein